MQQVRCAEVVYWHMELDTHDVVFAENLPAETYVDDGNRAAFEKSTFVQLHPDFSHKDGRQGACLPVATDGPHVTAAKQVLLKRATANGFSTLDDPAAVVTTGQKRIEPLWLSDRRLAFVLPPHCKSATLRSRTFVPSHLLPQSNDERRLGLFVMRYQLDGIEIPLESAWMPRIGMVSSKQAASSCAGRRATFPCRMACD